LLAKQDWASSGTFLTCYKNSVFLSYHTRYRSCRIGGGTGCFNQQKPIEAGKKWLVETRNDLSIIRDCTFAFRSFIGDMSTYFGCLKYLERVILGHYYPFKGPSVCFLSSHTGNNADKMRATAKKKMDRPSHLETMGNTVVINK
jgi:hypothetical protein